MNFNLNDHLGVGGASNLRTKSKPLTLPEWLHLGNASARTISDRVPHCVHHRWHITRRDPLISCCFEEETFFNWILQKISLLALCRRSDALSCPYTPQPFKLVSAPKVTMKA